MTMFFRCWGYIHLMLILLSVHASPLVTSIDDPPRDLVARQVHNQDESVIYNGKMVYGPFKGYIWFNGKREPSHEYGVPSSQVRGRPEYRRLRVTEKISRELGKHGFARISIGFLQPWPTRFDGGVPYGRLQIYGFNSNDAEVHAGPPIVISFE
ncbi:hypothetical protein C8R42DRAFT_648201 [Lentinula raphanica]|nr:hypothetical protein C8R42DRAFT_648201 [Lentinula raphanica]